MAATDMLREQWGQVREQWRSSVRVRAGCWIMLLIAIAGLLQLGLESADAGRARLAQLDEELRRMESLAKEKAWPDRVKDADQQIAALLALSWNEADLGLNQAALQDWVRNVSTRLGLKARDIKVVRVEDPKTNAALPPGHALLRARIVLEVPQRAPLMTFLAECARYERAMVVERLTLRQGNPTPIVELELRALARNGEKNT